MAIAEDKRRLSTRITAIQIAVLGCFLLLVGGFWFFQIAQHTRFREMADNNHHGRCHCAPRGESFSIATDGWSSTTDRRSTSRFCASTART